MKTVQVDGAVQDLLRDILVATQNLQRHIFTASTRETINTMGAGMMAADANSIRQSIDDLNELVNGTSNDS